MNAVPGTRHDRRRARTRAAILDAAERLFVSEGYAGARIEAIAEAADVAVGSIYSHFGSKDGLWSALAEHALELFDRYMQQAYDEAWSPLEQVIAAGDAYLRFHTEHPGSFRFLAFDGERARLPVGDDALEARVARRMAAILGEFEARIAAAMEAGEAVAGDARLHARFLWAAWNGTVGLSVRADELGLGDAEVEACLQQARALVLEGLTAPAFRGPDGRSRGRLVRVASPPGD